MRSFDMNGVAKMKPIITGEMLRAARAFARLEQAQLADASGLSLETIKRLERVRGPISAHDRTIGALTGALERFGVAIEPQTGGSVIIRLGREGPGFTSSLAPCAAAEETDLRRLIYYSEAAEGADKRWMEIFEDIERVSLSRNARLGVSGCLAAMSDRFLQALEGPAAAVESVYSSIRADARHRRLRVVEDRPILQRRFGGWVMCARPLSQAELARADNTQTRGFRPEWLSPAACLGALAWLADFEALQLRT